MNQAIFPSDLSRSDPLRAFYRAATAKAVCELDGGKTIDRVIERLWGKGHRDVDAIHKAAVSPASTTGAGAPLASTAVGTFLKSLRGRSAAAQLFTTPLRMEGVNTISLPRAASAWPVPLFVPEGGAIPAVQGAFGAVTLGPLAKLAMITGLSGELVRHSAEDAEAIVRELMDDATARALDVSVFSTAAASSTRPAGLLNGVTPITATPAGDGDGALGSMQVAMVADIKALVAPIVGAGGGAGIVIFANPVQAISLAALAANGIGYPVVPAPSLPFGTVVAIETNAIASAFPELPEVSASNEATIHFEDTTPQPISAAGTPNTAAAPVRNAFQQDMLILRLILPCAWVTRAPAMVQYVEGVGW